VTRAPHSFDVRQVPFLDLLGVRLIHLSQGGCRLELVVLRQHLRSHGIIHGGVVATLLDTAMGLVASRSAPLGQQVVTVQLNAHFIRPALEGETLVATGELKHSGRQTAVACGEVHTAKGVLVASGSATFMHRPHADASANRIAASRP
jgi:acyl-CoA thioesterase